MSAIQRIHQVQGPDLGFSREKTALFDFSEFFLFFHRDFNVGSLTGLWAYISEVVRVFRVFFRRKAANFFSCIFRISGPGGQKVTPNHKKPKRIHCKNRKVRKVTSKIIRIHKLFMVHVESDEMSLPGRIHFCFFSL